ncbi:zinc finger FYVE domain-containing protein 16 isoform X2 [Tiliqua scincoides]|uniref:zinc finger FYVE domain-containing protein 16 isoform X2 n=1 Tax=Tiliqua scincoides TaxID=71010 RepID=UPI003461E7F1
MDSYFKAAVSDLDKLLDEFELNTGEHEDNKTVNLQDSKYHLLTSELDYQQPKSLEPSVQEDSSSCAIAEELSLSTQTTNVAHFEQLNSEKNVTGLDLLSMVDGGSSDENQSSCLGRCSIPVCDLISDTGNLSHSECVQKLPSDNFQCSTSSLIGFDLALIPATACNLPAECSADSGTKQIDEHGVPYNIEYNAEEEQNQLALKTGSPAEANIVDSGGDKKKTGTLQNNEVFDHKEQTVSLDSISALIKEPIPDVHSSKDDTTCEDLSFVFSSSSISYCSKQVIDEESGKEAISEEEKIESIDANLPKIYELNKNSLNLPKEDGTSDGSLHSEDILVLHSTEEKLSSPEHNTNKILNISTTEISEDIQTSLSCLPLAVSICGSLVTPEVTNGDISQNEAADVISDITTMLTENYKNDLTQWELHETIEASGQEEHVNKTSQNWLGKSSFMDREKVDFDNITSKCELQNHTASFSSLEANSEMYSCVLPTDIGNRASVDLVIDEAIIKSNMLISDAELDAFLSEHCLEVSDSKPLKEDTDDGLLESDVIQNNLIEANQLSNKSDGSETEFKKMETYIENSSSIVSDLKPKFEGLEEEITLQLQQETLNHVRETESQVSVLTNNQQIVNNGGARPKQLLNFPPKAKNGSELSSPDTHGSESDVKDSLIPNSSCSDPKICPDSSSTYNSDTQSCLEDEGGEDLVKSTEVVEEVIVLGQKQPPWVPDSVAPNCMNCQTKFTFTKRRHHCRACGKVFCGPCCNRKCKLSYLDKEARVCISCYESIQKAHAFERMMSPTGPVHVSDSSEHCSTVPPLQEAQTSDTRLYTKEQRRVWFADGILPNGEVADTTKLSSGVGRSPQEPYSVETSADDTACTTDIKPKDETNVVGPTEILRYPTSVLGEEDTLPTKGQPELLCNLDSATPPAAEFPSFVEPTKPPNSVTVNEINNVPVSPLDYKMLCGIEKYVSKDISLIPEGDGLPPLLLFRGEKGDEFLVEEHPSHKQVMLLLESNPQTFILNANLLVIVRILPYCSERCWYFSTNGLCGLGQAEIIILLSCLPNEDDVPKEIFKLFINIYKDAMKGKFIGNLENITFTEGFLGNKEHGGFLFVTPFFQKLDDFALPQNPFLCGILIQKQEVPWAKVFPIRLMLRLGAEYGVYPAPLTSIRHRKPLFREIGHTVMNLLVDLRNYQYALHTIDGLFIHMEMGRSCIKIPLRKYNEVMKVVNTSNEHVISIGASFSSEADSHLVCVQNDDGVYQTQANSATGHPRKITGASFVVFNGALKASSGFLAKSSIVEDGIMVQITPETMDGLRQALREKIDFRITCGKVDSGDLREYVDICWVENEEKTNVRVTSPIDGKSMEGIESEKIVQEQDFEMNEKCIKCTEVFYLLKAIDLYIQPPYPFAKEIALASCAALRKHLKTLKSNGMNKIGLRVSMDTDMVEYQAGSGGQLLPQHYLNDLDSALIPLIHGRTSNATNLPLEMELIFFITESVVI